MSALIVPREGDPARRADAGPGSRPGFRGVMACIDTSEFASKVIPHAVAMAKAMRAELTLVRVLEARRAGDLPPDPVEWDMRRREAHDLLERVAEERCRGVTRLKTDVVEGEPAEQICHCAHDRGTDLTVLCTHGEGGSTEWELGGTARKVIDRIAGSLLLIPASLPDAPVAGYRRILLPLDGSPRAESVVPLAMRLAKSQDAELVLAHVVPVPELTEIGPFAAEDIELREQLVRRNERVALEYLDRIRARVAEGGIHARSIVLRNGDIRSRLAGAVIDETADLVILSAQGRSGRSDAPVGSVTAYLAAHAAVPLLIVRRQATGPDRRVRLTTSNSDVRLPNHATP
ncbi:MAG: universal stress protein [Bauldia sp.]|nr:universal stress protein [Bauldia sp.]